MRTLSVGMLALAVSGSPSSSSAQSAMARFDPWIGTWKGAGWSVGATGKRTDFTLTESVASRVGGKVLLVEGRGLARMEDGQKTVTHDGVVLVYYDESAGRYRWHGHDLAAAPVDTELRFVDGGFEWSITPDQRGTTVRFTILIDRQRWHELGEVSVDGTHWIRIMEVNLERQGFDQRW